MDNAYRVLMLTLLTGLIFAECRRQLHRWRAGEVGLARLGVQAAAILGGTLASFAVFRWLVPDHQWAALTIWILGLIVLGSLWGMVDDRLARWEKP